MLLNMGVQPRELNNVVDYPYQKANLIVQLRSWDAVEAKALLNEAQRYLTFHPVPEVSIKPAGIAYFNMVWNHEVLAGMLSGFIASSVLVLFLLVLDYRSFRWGLVSFIPLLFVCFRQSCVYQNAVDGSGMKPLTVGCMKNRSGSPPPGSPISGLLAKGIFNNYHEPCKK